MTASDFVGYLEHRTPERLHEFTENPGKGGYTIFGAAAGLQGLPWCATFVHAVLNRPDVLGRPHPGCRVLARRMKRKGLWRSKDYTPKPGDLIFLANNGKRIDHCGIVESCDGSTVTSIEGNAVDPSGVFRPEQGGAVARRTRALTDPRLVGYAAIG
jgi:hypothetical protein